MTQCDVKNEYFNWLHDSVCGKRYSKNVSYEKLLAYIHDTEFIYHMSSDEDRAEEGKSLRYRFACELGDPDLERCLDGPCSVLEMMVALAIHCEENIMDDSLIGNRTGQWFWNMIVNLGLGSMIDTRFDRYFVAECVDRFLNREYEPDGTGGLFKIRNCDADLRDVGIWRQMCWYLDSII